LQFYEIDSQNSKKNNLGPLKIIKLPSDRSCPNFLTNSDSNGKNHKRNKTHKQIERRIFDLTESKQKYRFKQGKIIIENS
jgi:hypothetical protein